MIYIWIRQTVDWEDEAAVQAQLSPRMAPKVELWNDTFDMPFHVFRHRVREIATANLTSVRDAAVAGWGEIPDGGLVVPIDDDDWLAPDLADALPADGGVRMHRWTASWVEVPTTLGHRVYLLRRRLFPWSAEKWACSSNNYAVVKDTDARPLLASHVRASAWVASAPPEAVRRIERRLSLINRTLASQTALRIFRDKPLSRSELVRKYRRYRGLYDRPPPAELAWAQPYVAAMAVLMRDLRLRSPR